MYITISILLPLESCVDAFEESPEFFDVTYRYKLDTSRILYNLHFSDLAEDLMPLSKLDPNIKV